MWSTSDDAVYYGIDKSDVYNCYLIQETKMPSFGKNSPQLAHRPELLTWMTKACSRFSQQVTTKHLAIYFMDQFMDNFIVDIEQLQLLTLCCLQIASKYEEKEIDIPRPTELVALCSTTHSNSLCMKMELKILEHLEWKVGIPTVAHLCQYLEAEVADSTDTVNDVWIDVSTLERAKTICHEYLVFFTDLVLKDLEYRTFKPSRLAAAFVAATRKLVGLEPVWPSRLAITTGYTVEQIEHPFSKLLRDYYRAKELQEASKKEATELNSPTYSSGYESRTPSPAYCGKARSELARDDEEFDFEDDESSMSADSF